VYCLAFHIIRCHWSRLPRLSCRIRTTNLTRRQRSSHCHSSIFYVSPSLCYLCWYRIWCR
jgi:hypothetical protein